MISTTSAVAAGDALAALFAPWVEWREESCRGGRRLITAINHRDGHGICVNRAKLCTAHPHHAATIAELRQSGFLADDVGRPDRAARPLRPNRVLVWRGMDGFVRRLYHGGLHQLFHCGWIVVQAILAVAGVVAVALTFASRPVQLHAHAAQIPVILFLGLVAIAVHELGHAVATVHYGRTVDLAGLRLHLGTPAFYVESLDALLLPRRHRLVQAAAGPWAEWLFTSLVALAFIFLDTESSAAALTQRFVVLNTVVIVTNLLPFVGLDGALLFADLIGQPDLQFRLHGLAQRSEPANGWIVVYAFCNALAAGALFVIAGYFWWQLFGGLIVTMCAWGPAGVGIIAIVGLAIGYQLVGQLNSVVTVTRAHLIHVWTKTVFRIERRWRVEAIHAFRALPELATLNAAELGIIAGRLQRCTARDVVEPNTFAVYVKGSSTSVAHYGSHVPRQSTVASPDIAELLAGRHKLVVLPVHWRDHLATSTQI
jgi:putative peptide zinc metalloprotease protein